MPKPDKYLDFDVSIWAEAGNYRARVKSPAGESGTEALPSIIGSEEKAAYLRLRIENDLLRSIHMVRGVRSSVEKHLQEFGRDIFEGILGRSSPFANLFSRSLDLADPDLNPEVKGLRVILSIEAPELAQLPWEYLYNATRNEWLGLNYRFPIIRFLVLDLPQPVLKVDGPLNILGMIANPEPGGEWEALDADNERNRIEQGVKKLREKGLVNFVWTPGGTLQNLLSMINVAPWHVFHFIGHGGIPDVKDKNTEESELEGFIVLTDENGGARRVSAGELAPYLRGYHGLPRLVVLNSCEGAREIPGVKAGSPATALVRAGIPAVVAMQFPISDHGAIEFGAAFYEELGNNLPIEAALTSARLRMQAQPKSRTEWGIPVLYTRTRNGQLFSGTRVQEGKAPSVPVLNASTQTTKEAKDRLRRLFSPPRADGANPYGNYGGSVE